MATKLLADLEPGDQIVTVQTIKAAWTNQEGTARTLVFTDDSTQVCPLAGNPSVEVAGA